MPDSKTHAILGVIAFATVAYFTKTTDFFLLAIGFVTAIVASQFPDIDTPQSKISQMLHWVLGLGGLGGLAWWFYTKNNLGLLVAGFAFVIFLFLFSLKHRGATHSYFALILTSVILYLINPFLSFAWAGGYLSHLFADSFSGGLFQNARGKYL